MAAVAVVGAGVAGLACARQLAAAGHAVTVFEKTRTAGGRIATQRTELGGFDHGAQYFTAREPAFADEVARWQLAGVAAPWPACIASLDAGGADIAANHAVEPALRYVGVPAMSAISAHLAAGLDIRYEARVVGVERIVAAGGEIGGKAAAARWAIKRLADASESGGIEVTEGLYDALVIALPADEATPLLIAAPELSAAAGRVKFTPCWALMLAFTEPIDADRPLAFDAAFVRGSRLAWIARESSKPQRRAGERCVAHAGSAWSIEHFDDDPEDVKAKLLRAFHDVTRRPEQPLYAAVHRWRHAAVGTPLADGFLWDATRAIGACGDWCSGARVEDAWTSGVSLAARIT